jgi:glycosyltransferase involved in cell wall biosynthesis
MNKKSKSCLVVTYGPVPTPEYQTVEGGGMRAWGLAKGLQANGIDVTVSVNESFVQTIKNHDGIKIENWSLDNNFIEQINSFDTVLMSYCMGDPSVFIAKNINDDVQLILDVYVPIYVEVSARDSEDMPSEYSAYTQDINRHNNVLKRGDYFICANNVQKIFYTGVLGSLGVVNPLSYRQDRIKIVPFGIHEEIDSPSKNPYKELGIKDSSKNILWFGGMYPWFRTEELLDSILRIVKEDSSYVFTFVGGKNPFNNNPDLLKQYEITLQYAKDNKLLGKNMYFVDWVDYKDRINWYYYADFVISLNQPGEENAFAWRTRMMDYVWGGVVPLTNGGDPLGDELIEKSAAIFLENLSSDKIFETVTNIYRDTSKLKVFKKNLVSIRPKYFWNHITKNLSEIINVKKLHYRNEQDFIEENDINTASQFSNIENNQSAKSSRLKKAVKDPRKALSYAKQKGIRRSIRLGLGIISSQSNRKIVKNKQFLFISHPIDNTGAPLVMLQIVDEVRKKYPSARIRVIAPYVDKKIESKLRRKKIKIEKAAQMSYGLTAAQLAINPDDFVFMNTVAIYDNYREVAFNLSKLGRLNKLHWFIHEDEAQLLVVKPVIRDGSMIKKINNLLRQDRIKIYVPSKRVKNYYDNLFDTTSIVSVPLRVTVPQEFTLAKSSSDYSKLAFYLSGTPSDGRKGQLIALAAFQQFLLEHYTKSPNKYRDFSVHFISIGDDYVSEQIKTIGNSTLEDRFNVYPSLPREEALEIASSCNVVICCSLNETFGLYIAEGMLMGHIVLRNDSAGMEEQLNEGKNGYFIDSRDVKQFALQLEKLLNKDKITDASLKKMGDESRKISKEWPNNTYLDKLI